MFERIRSVNRQLIKKGLTFKEMDKFWQDCIKKAKHKKTIKRLK